MQSQADLIDIFYMLGGHPLKLIDLHIIAELFYYYKNSTKGADASGEFS